MPLRSRFVLAAFGSIAATLVAALLVTDLRIAEELTVSAIALVIAGPVSVGFGALAVRPLAREREHLRERARLEIQASVRRFGEALRSTSIEEEGDGDPDLGPLLGVVLETALAAVGGRRGVVYRYDRVQQRLLPVAAQGMERPLSVDLGVGYAGWVAAHRTSLRVPASTSDVPSRGSTEPVDPEVIAAPLESSDALLGVLIVHGNTSGRPFTDDELDTLSLLGRQAAVGVENVLLHHEAKKLAVTDALTGIANYRAFTERLRIEFERAIRFGRPLSVVLCDVDHLKQINDRFGHQRGDLVLGAIAARMCSATRASIDLVARYGGDEFALILPETDADGAAAVAEKLRQAATGTPFGGGEQHVHATLSVGYATFPEHAADAASLVQTADLALYASKRAGRNLVRGPHGEQRTRLS